MSRQWSKQINLWTRSSFFFIVLSSLVAIPAIAQTSPRSNPAMLRPAASSIPVDQGYLLGAGDKIKLDVFSVPEYSGDYQVLADGTVNLPLAGSVLVQDMSLKDASAAISRTFREWLIRPIVTVSLLASRPTNVAVSGEVTRPGSYTTTLTEGGIPTLTKMLQLAGGMSQSADLQRVQVVRRSSRGGTTQTRTVDLRQLLRRGDISQDLPLRDGAINLKRETSTLEIEYKKALRLDRKPL